MKSYISKFLGHACLLLFLTSSSCSLFKASSKKQVDRAEPALDKITVEQVQQRIQEASFQYEWFAGKAKATLPTRDKNNSFMLHIRMRKDSIIWLSIGGPLGFEVARALITPDSIKLMDRTKKKFFVKDFGFLQKKVAVPIQFQQLQSILTGHCIFCAPKKLRFHSDTFATDKKEHFVIESKNREFKSTFWVNQHDYIMDKMRLQHLVINQTLTAVYKDFQQHDKQRFPHQHAYTIQSNKKSKLNLAFKKVEVNEHLEFPFNVPDKYEKVF